MISPKTKPGHLTLHQKHRGTRAAGGLVWVEKQRLEAFPVDSGLPAGKFAIPDSRYCTGKGNDGGWVLSPSQVSGGVRAGSDLLCAHPPTPEGMWGCWSPPKFRGSCISSPVCASVLQNPSSPTRLLSPGLDCGDSSREAVGREKGSREKVKGLWGAGTRVAPWGQVGKPGLGFWGCRGSLLGRAIAQPGQDLWGRF